MRQLSKTLDRSLECIVESTYNLNDVVALSSPIPEASLDAGLWGQVVKVLPDAQVEVEFTDRNGEILAIAAVPEEALCLVWAEPDDN